MDITPVGFNAYIRPWLVLSRAPSSATLSLLYLLFGGTQESMHFFGDFYVTAKRVSDNAIVHAKIYDRYPLAESAMARLTRQYPPPDYFVQLGTLEYLPSLRGHPEENVRTIASKGQIPEKLPSGQCRAS